MEKRITFMSESAFAEMCNNPAPPRREQPEDASLLWLANQLGRKLPEIFSLGISRQELRSSTREQLARRIAYLEAEREQDGIREPRAPKFSFPKPVVKYSE